MPSRIFTKHMTVTHYQVYMALMTVFNVIGSKVKVTDNAFQKCTIPVEA